MCWGHKQQSIYEAVPSDMIGIPMDQVAIYGAEKGRSKTGHFNWTGGENLCSCSCLKERRGSTVDSGLVYRAHTLTNSEE